MSSFTVTVRMEDTIPVIIPQGYYSGDSGEQVHELIDRLFREGHTSFLFDFSVCDIVNSPGVVSLMDLVAKIAEDYKGKSVLVGLDELKKTTFKMAGLTHVALVAEGVAAGLQMVQTD